jgi:hypothetical protein
VLVDETAGFDTVPLASTCRPISFDRSMVPSDSSS